MAFSEDGRRELMFSGSLGFFLLSRLERFRVGFLVTYRRRRMVFVNCKLKITTKY